MKIKDGFVLREVAGQHMAVPVGSRVNDLHGTIALNESGAFIWSLLSTERSEEELCHLLTEEYDITYAEAEYSINSFIDLLKKEDLLAREA